MCVCECVSKITYLNVAKLCSSFNFPDVLSSNLFSINYQKFFFF